MPEKAVVRNHASAWLCLVVVSIAFASTMRACSWGSETACRKPTLSGAETVALRLVGTRHAELVVFYEESTSTHKSTRIAANFTIGRPTWHSYHLKDDGMIYFWIGYEYPSWIKTSDQEPINPVQCRLGEYVASLIVTDGNVTLVRDGRETKLEATEPGAFSGYITMFE